MGGFKDLTRPLIRSSLMIFVLVDFGLTLISFSIVSS